MSVQEKIEFFQQLIHCNHDLPLRSYNPDSMLSRFEIPQGDLQESDYLLLLLRPEEAIQRHIQSGIREPLFLDDRLGLIWVAAFEYDGDLLQRVYILGPSYSGKNSYQIIKEKMEEHDLSVSVRARVFKYFERIPIVPSNQIYQYAIMLHYCITGTRITGGDLHFPENDTRTLSSREVNLITEEHRGIWAAEQTLLNMVREGNPEYRKVLAYSHSLSNGPRFDINNSLRKAKSTCIVLLTLFSRASIEGGVSPSIAYSLNDYYIQLIEDSKNTTHLTHICQVMMDDYVERVHREKETQNVSGQIKSICDYIAVHIREKISLSQIAAQAGYTEYYFSHKFKKEIGLSVSDYIKREKIYLAKLLLSSTNLSIQEIADELSFGSRNYFSLSFQKETGMSPSEYRTQNVKF